MQVDAAPHLAGATAKGIKRGPTVRALVADLRGVDREGRQTLIAVARWLCEALDGIDGEAYRTAQPIDAGYGGKTS